MTSSSNFHFGTKNATAHVAEIYARGKILSQESHIEELPGILSAANDAWKDVAITLSLCAILLAKWDTSLYNTLISLIAIALGLIFWKMGRSAWIGWARLQRLHHLLEQERWEIEHNREQEREELTALYAAKGFQQPLLNDVIDVLMADGDRLLRVMVEEELGLSLERQEHPLLQALGAGAGSLLAASLIIALHCINSSYGAIIAAIIALSGSAIWSSWYEQNRVISALFWLIGIGALAIGATFFLFDAMK